MSTCITYRAVTADDTPLLLEIYVQSRLHELEATSLSEEQKTYFLHSQFHLRARHYEQHYPGSQRQVILLQEKGTLHGSSIGHFQLDDASDEIRIIDISLLPAFRNRRIGTQVLRNCIARAERRHKSVVLHVEKLNRAQNLYRRLGFRVTMDYGVYLRMELNLHTTRYLDDDIHQMTGATSHG